MIKDENNGNYIYIYRYFHFMNILKNILTQNIDGFKIDQNFKKL